MALQASRHNKFQTLTNFTTEKSSPFLCRTTKLEVLIQVILAMPDCFFNMNICFTFMCFLLLLCVGCRKSIQGFVTDYEFRFDILSWKNLLYFQKYFWVFFITVNQCAWLLRVSKQIHVNENLKLCNVIYLCKQNELEGKC